MKVGGYIIEMAGKIGLTQSDLAREAGLSRQSLSYIVSGSRDMTIPQALRLESSLSLRRGTLVRMQDEDRIERHVAGLRHTLCERLVSANAFWSYDGAGEDSISDEDMVEKTFMVLDMDDISLLFELFPKRFVRKVWDERMSFQGEYIRELNMMIAQYYFGIDNPAEYLDRKEKSHIRKLTAYA